MSIEEINDKFIEHEDKLKVEVGKVMEAELAKQMELHVDELTKCYMSLLSLYVKVGKKLTKEERETREEIEKNRQIVEDNRRKIAEIIGTKTLE